MILRDLAPRLKEAARTWPSITLTGPRQSGKTTLCRALFPQHAYATLEAPDVRAFATEDPLSFLAQFPHGAILDEVQRAPALPSYLQGLIDADPSPGRWILTGSHNLALHQSVSQSLAGRTAVHTLLPLGRSEIVRFPRHPENLEEALFAGSYPRIFDIGLDPSDWLRSYVATYVERDVRMISNIGDLAVFQNFVALAAGRTAQFLNYSSLSGDCGISQPTAKAWLGILETSYLAFRLPAFPSNARKRLKKMPKLHFYDTGLVCWLLGIRHARAAAHASAARRDLRELGGLGDRQASDQPGRRRRAVLLPGPERRRGRSRRRTLLRRHAGRSQVRQDAVVQHVPRLQTRAKAAEATVGTVPHRGGPWRRSAPAPGHGLPAPLEHAS